MAEPAGPGVTAGEVGSVELARLSGLSYRQVERWTAERVLKPSVHGKGSGSRHQYPCSEGAVAAVLGRYNRAVGPSEVRLLARIAATIRTGDARWVRITAGTVTPVDMPAADGAVYLSVRP